MAKKVYIAEFDAHNGAYLRKISQMENATTKATSKIETSFSKISKAAMGYFSMAAITGMAGYAINAYKEQEQAIKRLEVALGRSAKGLTEYASQMQKISTFTDDNVLSAMALIANYVKEEALVKKLTKATMNLAIAKGIDLSSAAELVAKTVGSSTNALKRQGVEFDNNLKGTKRVNAVLEALVTYEGQAEGQLETTSGKFENLTNAITDNAEALGEKLLPPLNLFLEKLNSILNLVGSNNFDKLVKWMPQIGFAMQNNQMSKQEFQEKWNKTIKNSWFNIGGGTPQYLLGGEVNSLKDDRNWLNSVLAGGSGNGGDIDPVTGKPRRITGGNTTRDAINSRVGASGILDNVSARGISSFSRDMQEVAVPELQASFEDISLSFVQKFGETQNIAGNIANIFNVTADSFVGKLMQAFDVANSVLSIIASVASLAGSPLGFLGLAQGGTVINKNGKLSYAPIPKFARGGSYMVPAGYSNDSGLIRVQSGERVDVTPSNQVPMLGKALNEIKQAIMAGNMNSAKRGGDKVVVVVRDTEQAVERSKRVEVRQTKGGFKYD